MKPQDSKQPPIEVDALLRQALPDDLPEDVEARLQRTLEAFVASRRGERRYGRSWRFAWDWLAMMSDARRRGVAAVPASVLLVCGLAWHGAAGPPALAESLAQAHVTVSIADAARRASTMTCTGDVMRRFRSPGEFAEHVYRAWVQVGTAHPEGNALRTRFADPGEGVIYDLVVNPETMLPGEVRRVTAANVSGSLITTSSTCTWIARPVGSLPVLRGTEP